MKYLGILSTIALGLGAVLGGVVSGCGGDTVAPPGGGGMGGDGLAASSSVSSSSGNVGGAGGAGGGGTGGCSSAAQCDDGFSCTIDTCSAGVCGSVVGPNSGATACASGEVCQLEAGCIKLVICADDAKCITELGNDPCRTNIRCDTASATCTYKLLDNDNDGKPPVVCGGKDCNDNNDTVYPGAPEVCDGDDNNCNGTADESATCLGMGVCQAGACTCPADNTCGADCIDKTQSNDHCGTCFNACMGAASCINSTCECPANSVTCGATCVDTKTDPLNCGGCGKTCASGYSCVNSFCTCTGTPCGTTCIDTKNDPLNCGGCNVVCLPGSTCSNGACVCPGGSTLCNGQCVDTKTNVNHCGGCNVTCSGVCQNSMCTACTVANLYLFADDSGSMTDTATGGTKHDVMDSGINLFINDTLSSNMGVGLGYHPTPGTGTGIGVCIGTMTPCLTNADCPAPLSLCQGGSGGDSCTVADYTTPAVGIALLPGVKTAMTNSLSSHMPTGSSMPPPGLSGALQYSKAYAMSHGTQKVAVVLLSDGFPNICNTNTDSPADLIPIAQQYASGSPKVVTYVIGIGNGVSPNPTLSQWNQVASAGGTGTAQMANSAAEIANALRTIRSQFKTCP